MVGKDKEVMNDLGKMMREWFDYLSSGHMNVKITMTRHKGSSLFIQHNSVMGQGYFVNGCWEAKICKFAKNLSRQIHELLLHSGWLLTASIRCSFQLHENAKLFTASNSENVVK